MEYLLLFLLFWWAFGVVLIFSARTFDKIPTLALYPAWVAMLVTFAACIVCFPLPMLAPFEEAWIQFRVWRVKRKLTKAFRKVSKGKNAEIRAEFEKMIDVVKKL